MQITSVPYYILEPGLFYEPRVLTLVLSVFRQRRVISTTKRDLVSYFKSIPSLYKLP